jgi:uncharacterized membrane protein YecN with MAPEG domain
MVYCPACPEADVNLELGWEKTPEHLRHVCRFSVMAASNAVTGIFKPSTILLMVTVKLETMRRTMIQTMCCCLLGGRICHLNSVTNTTSRRFLSFRRRFVFAQFV